MNNVVWKVNNLSLFANENTETVNQLKIFPNPAQSITTLIWSSPVEEEVKITLTNYLGEKIMELNTPANKATKIPLSLAPGLYYFSTTTNQGNYHVSLIIR